MFGRLKRLLWRLTPHTCAWEGFTAEYGGGAKCRKCGHVGYVWTESSK